MCNTSHTITRMKAIFIALLLAASLHAHAEGDDAAATGDDTPGIGTRVYRSLAKTWNEGNDNIMIPFHVYHMRFAYTPEKIASYNEQAWGIGYGRGRYDDSGNLHGLYLMTFLDSHKNQEPIAGYAYQLMWGEREGFHAGVGGAVFLTARLDIMHYVPFPGAAPLVSINYNRFTTNVAYIPGGKGFGNVLFFWASFGI
jgi:palmitoyl transferase